MTISKKLRYSILGLSMMFVFAFLALTGCGGVQTESLTKEEYAEAMNATYEVMVDADANISTAMFRSARAISDEDYTDLTRNNEGFTVAKNLIKLTSGIMANEEYELTDKIIMFVATPNAQAGKANFKMELKFANNLIYVSYLMTSDQVDGVFYQFIDAQINYDFESKEIKAYEIDFVSRNDSMESMNRYDRYVYSPSTGTKMLSQNASSYEEVQNEKKQVADNFYNAEYVQTDYDFSEEFPKA